MIYSIKSLISPFTNNVFKKTLSKVSFSDVRKNSIPKEYLEHFHNKKSLLHLFSNTLFKKTHKPSEIYYIVGTETAKTIASIVNNSSDSERPIIEVNPGLGTLTHFLLKAERTGINLKLIEGNEILHKHLHKLYGNRITCLHNDFCNMWKFVYLDNGERFSSIMKLLPKQDWKDKPPSKIIVSSGSLMFYKHLMTSVLTNTSIFSSGRHEIFAVMPPILYFLLTSTNQIGYGLYRSTSVLFQILFEFEFITKLDRKDFLPWPSKQIIKKHIKYRELKQIDTDSLYFVKIVPRKKLFDCCPQKQMNQLTFFVNQNFTSRKNRVIPALERYIPNAGKEMILSNLTEDKAKILHRNENLPNFCAQSVEISNTDFYPDLNIFTEFGDLTPNQILTLFTIFKNFDGFQDSAFISNMQLYMKEQMMPIDETVCDNIEIK
ncbi:dimethyladenosine transferase 2, mitochondrial [Culicoides brevitarsis]|uniref:dimethyladenosine transferase 2, mitochondrial n=1 Tax=Culicoides brevitarsis TaxID=469753 RepID=UPI00307CA45E